MAKCSRWNQNTDIFLDLDWHILGWKPRREERVHTMAICSWLNSWLITLWNTISSIWKTRNETGILMVCFLTRNSALLHSFLIPETIRFYVRMLFSASPVAASLLWEIRITEEQSHPRGKMITPKPTREKNLFLPKHSLLNPIPLKLVPLPQTVTCNDLRKNKGTKHKDLVRLKTIWDGIIRIIRSQQRSQTPKAVLLNTIEILLNILAPLLTSAGSVFARLIWTQTKFDSTKIEDYVAFSIKLRIWASTFRRLECSILYSVF